MDEEAVDLTKELPRVPAPLEGRRDLLFARWDDEKHRYVLKEKKPSRQKPNKCVGVRCRHDRPKGRNVCHKCRKRMQRLNAPVSVRLSDIQARIRTRDYHEFDISTPYACALLAAQGLWEKFHQCPGAYHLDRRDPRLGYVEGNVRWMTAHDNLSKSAKDKVIHQNAKLDENHIDCPF